MAQNEFVWHSCQSFLEPPRAQALSMNPINKKPVDSGFLICGPQCNTPMTGLKNLANVSETLTNLKFARPIETLISFRMRFKID